MPTRQAEFTVRELQVLRDLVSWAHERFVLRDVSVGGLLARRLVRYRLGERGLRRLRRRLSAAAG